MDRQALVTFLFKAPPEVRTVELLGSWDNFQQPYVMHHDRRRGHGFWSGCFEFQRIVFDGDKADWSKPRCGGLKQGGTYWYFYRLDHFVEAFDDSRDCTRECPLLPGQTLNVIDVPVEVHEPPSRRRSATLDAVDKLDQLQRTHTLDPGDKSKALEPPPVSKVHERCVSDLALNGRLESKPHSFRDVPGSPVVSPASTHNQADLDVPRQGTADDGRSLRPRTGWSSSPPSQDGSTIFNAYTSDGREVDAASLSAFPMPNVYRPSGRPITRDGGSAYRGFDYARSKASSRHSLSRTGDDDLDGSSFILEPTDSPPPSAYGSSGDWRFAVPAKQDDQWPRHTTFGHRHPHRHSEDSYNPDADEGEDDEITSPTFSAATISSEGGGVNTPFRLSGGYHTTTDPPHQQQPPTHDQTSPSDYHASSMHDITTRLQTLASESSAASLPSQTSTPDRHRDRAMLGHYALPALHEHDNGSASATTLGKLSSTSRTSIAQVQEGQGEGGGGFAESIFSELGYLGASIA